jgi:DNA-binding CsgD family transcriptional regulator/N-acetylneuraminic acid mutarotase
MQKELPLQDKSELTEREREILRLAATGNSNKNIALQLSISPNTVKVHLRNIFAKIGVASRTEAALYAIQTGLSQSPESRMTEPPTQVLPAITPIPLAIKGKSHFLWIGALATVLLVGVVFVISATRFRSPSVVIPSSTSTVILRWDELAAMPTARSGLAVAVYENKIYTIGGETAHGVTGVMEQYDVTTNAWITLKPKPVPVTDIYAAVIGGQIYIPGGRLASGGVTDVLESYDPGSDQWETHAALPLALSGYALAAFEGKLYVFGGWDGQKYLASVYEYDPEQDTWLKRWPMPTARAFAGAAVAGGSIYVIGGTAGGEAFAVNEEYEPERDTGGTNPWTSRSPIPEARSGMGVASIADIIHIVGGDGQSGVFHSFEYFPQSDKWQSFEFPVNEPRHEPGVGVVETNLHMFGGLPASASSPTGQHWVYQAIYTIFVPIIR